MQPGIAKNIVRFVFLFLLQVLLLEHIHLPGNLHLLLYPVALLLLPMQLSNTLLILIGFGFGFLIDICCGTPGLNAAASTFMMFSRIVYFKITETHDTLHDSGLSGTPLPSNIGWGGFMRYSGWMSVLFCLMYFFLEAGSFRHFFYMLYLILGSALLCFLSQIVTVSLFVKRVKK